MSQSSQDPQVVTIESSDGEKQPGNDNNDVEDDDDDFKPDGRTKSSSSRRSTKTTATPKKRGAAAKKTGGKAAGKKKEPQQKEAPEKPTPPPGYVYLADGASSYITTPKEKAIYELAIRKAVDAYLGKIYKKGVLQRPTLDKYGFQNNFFAKALKHIYIPPPTDEFPNLKRGLPYELPGTPVSKLFFY